MSLEGIYGGADTCGVAPFTEAQSLLDASHGELHKSDRRTWLRVVTCHVNSCFRGNSVSVLGSLTATGHSPLIFHVQDSPLVLLSKLKFMQPCL